MLEYLAAIYSVAIMMWYLIFNRSYILLIPLVMTTFFLAVKKFRIFFPYILYANTFLICLGLDYGLYFAIPLSIYIPFTFTVNKPTTDIQTRGFLGPSAFNVFRILTLSSLLILVNTRVLMIITLASIATVVYTIYGYSMLSKIKVSSVLINDTAALGDKVVVAVRVESPTNVFIVIESGGKHIQAVKERAFFEISYSASRIGKNVVELNVYAFDEYMFSFRHIARHLHEYRVVPLTQRILWAIARRFQSLADVEKFRFAVEITVTELHRGSVTAPSRGREALRMIREYASRRRSSSYEVEVLKRFSEILEELLTTGGLDYAHLKKSRLGEYISSRPYTPGDAIKHVHWKKSVSKGYLIVKEFTSPSINELQGVEGPRLEPIILVDIFAPNALELDRIVYEFLKLCVDILTLNPFSKVLVIVIVGDIVVGLRGTIQSVLYQLYKVFKDLPMNVVYEYEPRDINEEIVIEAMKAIEKPKPLAIAFLNNDIYANSILKLILDNMFTPPKPIKAIYSKSLIFRYTVVLSKLISLGYQHMDNLGLGLKK